MTPAIISAATTTKVETTPGRIDSRVLAPAPTPPASNFWTQEPHTTYVVDATPVAIQIGERTVYVPARVNLSPKAVLNLVEPPTYINPNANQTTVNQTAK